MKTLYLRTALTALALATATTTSPAQLQTQATQQPPDSVVAVVADALGLPFVPPDQRPFFGAFWGVRSSLPCITPPMPCPPLDPNTPVYAIGDPVAGGQFLVDETAGQVISPHAQSSRRLLSTMDSASTLRAQVDELQNFIAQTQARQAEALLRANGQMDALALDGQDGGGVFGPMGLDSYTASDLWLSISQITNGVAPLVIHGTLQDVTYEILSRQTLTDTIWTSETNIQGAADQDWTPTTVAVGSRTNALFLWCRSWIDSNGSGIPDWWLLQYFGSTDIDPYALCPSGDGWTILQAYQNGWNPNLFYTPPPPQNVAAVLATSGANATITWAPGGGPVTNYAIYRGGYLGQVGSSTFSFADSWGSPPYDFVPDWTYTVRAYFTNGAYADSQPACITAARLSSSMAAVRGPAGRLYLVVGSVPADLSSVRLYWEVYDYSVWADVFRSTDLNAADLVRGAALLPLDRMTGYSPGDGFAAQCIGTNGSRGAVSYLSPSIAVEETTGGTLLPPARFVDARCHLKENLKFLLQSATLSQPFSYEVGDIYYPDPTLVWFPETGFARPPSPTSYEYSGFHVFSSNLNYSILQEFRPVQENYLWRNLAYDSGDFDASGDWTTGAESGTGESIFRVLHDPEYQFTGTNDDPLPLALSLTNHGYLFARWVPSDSGLSTFQIFTAELGLLLNESNQVYVPTGVRNSYGLPLNSVFVPGFQFPNGLTLPAGGATGPIWDALRAEYFFCDFQTPTLQTTNYYFASQTRYLNSDYTGWSGSGPLSRPAPPLPGSPTFSVTNTSPLLITGFGQPITVAGWAKQAIENGYSGRYAYLEQYFDKAYTTDGSGNVTTNEAGLLSPYGEFLPMQPGPAALVTMADIDAPYQRGTGVVNVIKLQLDVNHDGTMDLSFAGPDNTAQVRPFTFWVNSNYDRKHNVDCGLTTCDTDQDDLQQAGAPGNESGIVPDYAYGTFVPFVGLVPSIPCEKDLEDYARLWMPGLSNIMAVMPASYTVKLTLTGDGAIRLFRAVEPSGGTNYLFDPVTASNQVAQSASLYVGVLSSNSPITLTNRSEHYIWCGVQRGSAQIDLQILDGTNKVADTTAYFQLKDIKEMYERWTAGDAPSRAPTNTAFCAAEGLPQGVTPFQYASPDSTNTPYILFVHGWNMELWEKDRFAETAFKRLYWQGYQGRFGTFRWPTDFDFNGTFLDIAFDARNYDSSEYNAWRSGQGLLNKLNELNAKYPAHVYLLAHSMGNVVAGEALRLSGTNRVVNTYAASQAAVPAHTYDNSIPDYSFTYGINFGPFTPNIYKDWFSSNNGAATRRINYYNTNDYALQRGRWELNQLIKTTTSLFGWTYGFNGYPHMGYPNSATNHYTAGVDDTPPWNYFFKENFFGTDVYLDIVNTITNRYEVMAYAAQARSAALGRSAGVLERNVDLSRTVDRIWPTDPSAHNYGDHKWHSGQFRATLMEQQNYWRTLLYTLDGFNLSNP